MVLRGGGFARGRIHLVSRVSAALMRALTPRESHQAGNACEIAANPATQATGLRTSAHVGATLARGQNCRPEPSSQIFGSRPGTLVTFQTGHMGDTPRGASSGLEGGTRDALEQDRLDD